MAKSGSSFICENILGRDMVIDFDYEIIYEGCEAKLYGPPENCYPAEPMEYDLTFVGISYDAPNSQHLEVPDWLKETIEEYLAESDDVYERIQSEAAEEDEEYEYDEDYYRDER